MSDVRFRLKGWMAVPFTVIVIGFLGYRLLAVKTTLASEGAELLKLWLRSEYASDLLGEIQVEELDRSRVDPKVQSLLDSRKVEFTSISARGTDPVYVKVTIQVNGKEPPDGRSTRYYIMEYSTVTGWRVRREISALSYYLHLF